MKIMRVAGIVYTVASACVVAFQIALALGAPWGAYAIGGAYGGQLPPAMRVSAMVQAAVLALLAGVVLARAGLALRAWSRASRWAVWLVVAVAAVSLLLNLITPSAGERMIWAPVAFVMLVSSLLVATGHTKTGR